MASNYNTRPLPAEVMVDDGPAWRGPPAAGGRRTSSASERVSQRGTVSDAAHRHPDHRLRLAVHPAHRAARARGARLLRDPSAHADARVDPRVEAEGHHPLRRAELGVRRRRAARPTRRCSTLGIPILGICYGMQLLAHLGGGQRGARPSGASTAGPIVARRRRAALRAASTPGEETPVWMSHGDHVDEPPPGYRVTGVERQQPRSPPFEHDAQAALRRAVPPRGGAHAARWRDPQQLPLRHLRLHARLDAGPLHRDRGRADPRAGRARRAGDLRPLGRRGLARWRRRWCTGPSATGSPASSWTTACCACTSATRSSATFRAHLGIDLRVVDAGGRFPRRARRA